MRIPAGNRLTDYRAARSAFPAVRTDPMSSSRNGGIAAVKGGNLDGPFDRVVRGVPGASSSVLLTEPQTSVGAPCTRDHARVACWNRTAAEQRQANARNTTTSRSEIASTVQSSFLRRVLSWWGDGTKREQHPAGIIENAGGRPSSPCRSTFSPVPGAGLASSGPTWRWTISLFAWSIAGPGPWGASLRQAECFLKKRSMASTARSTSSGIS